MAQADINKITSSTATYKVCKGDALSLIAQRCINVGMSGYSGLSPNTTGVQRLMKLNPDITNKNLIYVGQTLTLQGTAKTKTTTKAQRVKITAFGLQSDKAESNAIPEITVYATWAWDRSNTESYRVLWRYATGDSVGWVHTDVETTKDGTDHNTTYRYSKISSIPANATHVTFQVKPISKTYKKNNKDVHYWTADWSEKKTYWFKDIPPEVPPALTENDITVSEATKKGFFETILDVATGETSISDAVSGNNKSGEKIPYKVTFKLTGLQKSQANDKLYLNAHEVQFQVIKNDTITYKTGRAKITATGDVSYECDLAADAEYKVRVRSYRGAIVGTSYSTTQGTYSDWSDYSPAFGTPPNATQEISTLYFWKNKNGEYVMRVGWYEDPDKNARYVVGYTTEKVYFDTNQSGITTTSELDTSLTDIVLGNESIGKELFFAVKTVTSKGTSVWSAIRSITVGTEPGKPTSWSSSSTAMLGDQIILYWSHNTKDSSPESVAKLDISIDGVHITYNTATGEYVENIHHDESNRYAALDYELNYITKIKEKDEDGQVTSTTSAYALTIPDNDYFKEGAVIQWRVMSAGVYTDIDDNGDEYSVYSEWSDARRIDVYAKPSLTLSTVIPDTYDESGNATSWIEVGEYADGDITSQTPVTHFPIVIAAACSIGNENSNQKPVGYYVSVTAVESYETVDTLGNVKMVKEGEVIFDKHIDSNLKTISTELNPGNIDLENNQRYIITCKVSMDSGLSAENSRLFAVEWTDEEAWPSLDITYDPETYTTQLRPYCADENGELMNGVTISVYRREFDGTYTELSTGLDNISEQCIVDPHPSLDYARYRVVAQTNSTGAISFYDVPAFPINEKAMIIQWDEEWQEFDINEEYEAEGHPWTGSLLRLPYNIDISDEHSTDAELVRYIGREHPVGYYGTQLGHNSTWATEIPKSDNETLYGIRRLARWKGNVYVREPSGSGYWANITVSYSQKHTVLTIPITFKVTRVEGE